MEGSRQLSWSAHGPRLMEGSCRLSWSAQGPRLMEGSCRLSWSAQGPRLMGGSCRLSWSAHGPRLMEGSCRLWVSPSRVGTPQVGAARGSRLMGRLIQFQNLSRGSAAKQIVSLSSQTRAVRSFFFCFCRFPFFFLFAATFSASRTHQ